MSSAPALAQGGAAAGGSPAAATSDQKLKQLEDCVSHMKQARAGWSQEPNTQEDYTIKIKHLRGLEAAVKNGKDVSQVDIDKACKSPGSSPY